MSVMSCAIDSIIPLGVLGYTRLGSECPLQDEETWDPCCHEGATQEDAQHLGDCGPFGVSHYSSAFGRSWSQMYRNAAKPTRKVNI